MLNSDLIDLVNEYATTLRQEYDAQFTLADLQANTKQAIALTLRSAYDDGTIDGKNADIRKSQEEIVIANNSEVFSAKREEQEADRKANLARIERERLYQLIQLTKAWLQSNVKE